DRRARRRPMAIDQEQARGNRGGCVRGYTWQLHGSRDSKRFMTEPTTLPDGTVVDLVAGDEGDTLTDEERRALHAALSKSWESAEVGRVRSSFASRRRTAPAPVSLRLETGSQRPACGSSARETNRS